MKRTFIIGLLLIALCCCEAYAQRQFRKPLKTKSQAMEMPNKYNIGLKTGCPWSYMQKNNLKEVEYDGIHGYLIGIIGERNLGKWSIALESTFALKGTKMHNKKRYQITLSQEGIMKTQFEVAYNVATVRIPVTYYFKGLVQNDKLVPYLFAGPEIDIPMGETTAIIQKFDGPHGDHPLEPTETPFKPCINASAVAGLGLMTKIRFESTSLFLKLDAAYNHGLLNLAVPTKEAWKWPFEKQDELIFAHDVEVNLSIVYPIKKILRDACYSFR